MHLAGIHHDNVASLRFDFECDGNFLAPIIVFSTYSVQSIVEVWSIHVVNITTFDLNLLRVFAAVYAERNVSRAASVLGLTQPAISNALIRLRRSCDDSLFERTRAGMEPTALAQQLIGPVREGLGLFKNALESPKGFDPPRSERRFRLLMSDVSGAVILPGLMRVLANEAPGIGIEAIQIPLAQYVAALEQGHADLAIGNLSFLRAGFLQQRLFTTSYCCIARRGHPEIGKRFGLEQYLGMQHIAVSGGNADPLVDHELGRKRRHRKVHLRVTHYHAAVDIVAATSLIATLPQVAVRSTEVQTLAVPLKLPRSNVRQFWHRRTNQDPGHRWLRAVMARISLTGQAV